MDKVISRRVGKVIIVGNSYAIPLKNEILDSGLEPGSDVIITLRKDKKIVIEKVIEEKTEGDGDAITSDE